jgi:hypothetical protein
VNYLVNYIGRAAVLRDDPNLQDLDAVEALIQGLALFQGGVLMVFLNSLLSLHFLSKMDIDSST